MEGDSIFVFMCSIGSINFQVLEPKSQAGAVAITASIHGRPKQIYKNINLDMLCDLIKKQGVHPHIVSTAPAKPGGKKTWHQPHFITLRKQMKFAVMFLLHALASIAEHEPTKIDNSHAEWEEIW